MNKIMIAVAASILASGAAMAQSGVTVYGVTDAALVYESGGPAGSVTNITSGVASGSRIGFKGKEDLGGGRKVYFVLENGLNLDTGSAAQGGLLFGRQAYVGVSSELGALSLGRQYSPYYRVMSNVGDPFCAGFAGNAGNIMATNTRVDNMLGYASPSLRGFTAELAVAPGEQPGNSAARRTTSGSLSYTNAKLVVALARHRQQDALGTDSRANTMLAARYNFGIAEASLGYVRNTALAGARSNDTIVGLIVPFGATKLYASFIRHEDATAAGRDARQAALGVTYELSKRTDLYAAYAHISQRNGATFRVGNATTDGTGNTGANLGIRHTF